MGRRLESLRGAFRNVLGLADPTIDPGELFEARTIQLAHMQSLISRGLVAYLNIRIRGLLYDEDQISSENREVIDVLNDVTQSLLTLTSVAAVQGVYTNLEGPPMYEELTFVPSQFRASDDLIAALANPHSKPVTLATSGFETERWFIPTRLSHVYIRDSRYETGGRDAAIFAANPPYVEQMLVSLPESGS